MKKRSILSILGVIVIMMALVPHWSVEASKPVAIIVDKTGITGQVNTFAPVTLFTPTADGDYRISIYLEAATVGAGKNITLEWDWTDNNAAQNSTVALFGASTNARDRFTDVIHVTSGNAIVLKPQAGFNDNTDSYNVFVTVEEL